MFQLLKEIQYKMMSHSRPTFLNSQIRYKLSPLNDPLHLKMFIIRSQLYKYIKEKLLKDT